MKIIDFIIGILVLFFGAITWAGKIGNISGKLGSFGTPGATQYQIIICGLGVLLILYSLAGKKKSA